MSARASRFDPDRATLGSSRRTLGLMEGALWGLGVAVDAGRIGSRGYRPRRRKIRRAELAHRGRARRRPL